MKKAEIKIEVLYDNRHVVCDASLEGETWLLMLGLTNAINAVEQRVPEEDRSDYRAKILHLLNTHK